MRKATLIGTLIATMLVLGLMMVPVVGANKTDAPVFQATATGEATAEATEEATAAATEEATAEATTEATAAATAAATSAAATTAPATTATKAPGALPNTGGDSGMGLILLGAAVLLIMGAAVAMLVANRRGMQP
jgi:LPXTG-motif cell wall-anchored protein